MKRCLGLVLVVYIFWFGTRPLYAGTVDVTLDVHKSDRAEALFVAKIDGQDLVNVR